MTDIKAVCPALSDILENTSERIAFFFGAGISAALAGKSYGWESWVRDGIARLPDPDRQAAYRARLGDSPEKKGEPSADTLTAVLEDLIAELKGLSGGYEAWMRQAFGELRVANAGLAAALKKLLLFQDIFVTTNYDSLLTQATGVKAASYLRPDVVYSMLDNRRNDHIVHIHGRYSAEPEDSEDSIIATDSQYDSILENQGAQFIQRVIGTRPVVFIGCGKTASDKNISRFITFAKEHLKLEKPCFFLYREGQRPDDLPENVTAVCYGAGRGDLPGFLGAMADERAAAFVKDHAFIELFPSAITDRVQSGFSRYYFAAEGLSFQGREKELAAVERFLARDDPFLWCAVTGQSGSGKSRFALEVCRRYGDRWCAFFIKPHWAAEALDRFTPYRDTIVVVDELKGLEKNVAALVEKLSAIFAPGPYRLRVLFCERESSAIFGTWFDELERSFTGGYLPIFRAGWYGEAGPSLVLGDLEDGEIERLIGEICAQKDLPPDKNRDKALRRSYHDKLEMLHYRPLFLQMYVESWIDNSCAATRFDGSAGLIEDILRREQGRWRRELGGDYALLEAWTHLLLMSAVAGRLTEENIPAKYRGDLHAIIAYVKEHSFPGKQREERFISLVSDMCHSVGQSNAYIEVMYPDVLKEYCFLYYLSQEDVAAFSEEMWAFAPGPFSRMLIRMMGDFPYHEKVFLAVDGRESYRCLPDALTARVHLLDNVSLQPGDDLALIRRWTDREYDFWHGMAAADEGHDDMRTTLTALGLDRVAQQYGAQNMPGDPTIDRMLGVFDEVLALPGGDMVEMTKLVLTQGMARRLSMAGGGAMAEELLAKVNRGMTSDSGREMAEATVLEQYNTDIMNHLILEGDFAQGYEVLKKDLEQVKKLSSAECLAYFLGTCHKFGYLAFEDGKERYIERAEHIAAQTEGMFDDDESVICARCSIRLNRLQYEILVQNKTDQAAELRAIIKTGFSADGKYGNECLGIAATLLLNLTEDRQELEKLQARLKERIDSTVGGDDANCDYLAQAYLRYHQKLKELRGARRFTKEEIDDAYSYMLRFPGSESVRSAFMEMLEDSEEAGNRSRYMRREVVAAAHKDALFNPLNPSGIEEIDLLHSLAGAVPTEPYRRQGKKVGANDPCPCGSGKKFKKCCRGNGKYD